MNVFYIIATTAGRYRAHEGARFPWTREETEAQRFTTTDEALKEIRSIANFQSRSYNEFELIEVLEDPDHMPMALVEHDGYTVTS